MPCLEQQKEAASLVPRSALLLELGSEWTTVPCLARLWVRVSASAWETDLDPQSELETAPTMASCLVSQMVSSSGRSLQEEC